MIGWIFVPKTSSSGNEQKSPRFWRGPPCMRRRSPTGWRSRRSCIAEGVPSAHGVPKTTTHQLLGESQYRQVTHLIHVRKNM